MKIRMFIAIILIAICGANYIAYADDKISSHTPLITDVMPSERRVSDAVNGMFENVKGTHIIVCTFVQSPAPYPEWLSAKNLAKNTFNEITELGSRFKIKYIGQSTEPDIIELPCDGPAYNSVLDKADNLNFIIKVTVHKIGVKGNLTPIAEISRYIYRPGYGASISAFLLNRPYLIDLSNWDDAHKEFIERYPTKAPWAVGYDKL